MSAPPPAVAPAFADPVIDAAHTFRALLDAMSQPGTVRPAGCTFSPPKALGLAMAATMLTLCDTDTRVALVGAIDGPEVDAFLRFHTGAPRAAPPEARFVFADRLPTLGDLKMGTDTNPELSATVVVEMTRLGGDRLILRGPGIDGTTLFDAEDADGHALSTAFLADWRANNARFPRGVDLVLTCGQRLAALPRTTRIEEA